MLLKKNYLPQIDGLRALAVLAVIIYHYFVDWLPSGFLGVDIFFVISGFVISRYLFSLKPTTHRKYLLEFYEKRIKRLLPALVVCTIFTSLALILLTTRPPSEMFRTGAIALFGLSNFYLLRKSEDYFAIDTNLNPFTHTWSLGVEEQFYIFYPMFLLALGISYKKISHSGFSWILYLTLISFIAYLLLGLYKPIIGFYMLPARAWEFGMGAIAFFIGKRYSVSPPEWLSSVSLIIIILMLFLPPDLMLISTIIVVISTFLLITSCNSKTLSYRLLTLNPFIFIGLLSYSLYLWHWPILIIGKLTIGTFGWASALLILLTIIMSIMSYYLVELPLRYKNWFSSSKTTISISIFVSLIVGYIVFNASELAIEENNLVANYFEIPRVPQNTNKRKTNCIQKFLSENKVPPKYCLSDIRTEEKPHIIFLVGDSHASQFSGVFSKALQKSKYSVITLNLNHEHFPQKFTFRHEKSDALDYIKLNAKKNDVVAISFHRGYLNFKRDKHIPLTKNIKLNMKSNLFFENISFYISSFKNKGIKTLLINDGPLMQIVATSESCLMQIKFFGKSDCRISKVQNIHTRTRQDIVFNKLALRYSSICQWDPLIKLYENKDYIDVIDGSGKYIMADWHHLTNNYAEDHLTSNFLDTFNKCFDDARSKGN